MEKNCQKRGGNVGHDPMYLWNFLKHLPMIIPGQFGFNCLSGFREEAFWNTFLIGSNVNLSPAVAAISNFISEQNLKFVEDHPMNIHVQFCYNNICSFWEEALQSQEILNRPVVVLDILNRVWTLLKILSRFWTDSEHYLKFWTDSEQILNITENSEQILNIIFLLKSIYFTSFSLDFN